MDISWRRRLSRSLSAIENRAPGWREILAKSYAEQDDTLVVGVTGPPGGGKSTLIDALAAIWAKQGHRIGIIAIDPASPFSGGAVLGDRVRMRRSEDLDNVFIRSMSARGYSGGLNESALDLCTVMASFGLSRILLETVGVGQNDVEVAFVADCTLVVSVPGLGDSVQAAKAGLMEVGDIYVVNKGDLPGARAVAQDIAAMLALVFAGEPGRNAGALDISKLAAVPGETRKRLYERYGDPSGTGGSWHPPAITVAATDCGTVATLAEAIDQCGRWLEDSGQRRARRASQIDRQLRAILQRRLLDKQMQSAADTSGTPFNGWIQTIADRQLDPHCAADRILADNRNQRAED